MRGEMMMRDRILKKSFLSVPLTGMLSLALSHQAWGLDSAGNGPTRNDAVALYVFSKNNIDPTTWTIKDLAANPLDLKIVRTNALFSSTTEYLDISEPNLIRSVAPANKIVTACKNSNELTVEMWVENKTPSEKLVNQEDEDKLPTGYFKQALRMVSLSDTYFKEFHNFAFYQTYNMGDAYKATTRTSVNSPKTNYNGDLVDYLVSPKENFLLQKKQHIIFVKTAGGAARLYNSDENGNDTGPFVVSQGFAGDFSNWHVTGTSVTYDTPDDATGTLTRALDMRLAIGNEASADLDFSKPTLGGEGPNKRSRHWPWMGKLYMVAVYCRALTESEILGAGAPRTTPPPVYQIDVSRRITPTMKRAQTIYTRITGVKTPIDNPVIGQMADLMDQNQSFQAAALATQDPNFLNITVRDMASKMSTRDELISSPLNDFTATIVGATRDGLDARSLLSSDLIYVADPKKAAVPSSLIRDQLTSNRHYEALQAGGFDLAKVLVPSKQMMYDGTKAVPHPDPAGLLTTRGWMSAHAIAGTNRRMVEYAFREFLCTPIDKWSDSNGSDAPIGRDVDRFPGGSHTKFTTTCRNCHSRMDPLRSAFAYFTFSNGFAKHSLVVNRLPAGILNEDTQMGMAAGLKPTDPANTQLPNLGNVSFVADKMNHNEQVFPGGRVIVDNSFINAATEPWAMNYFGWRGPVQGNGAKDFGSMVANSKQFSRCLAKRVFASVCKRETQSFDEALMQTVANEFETNGYKLDYLFKRLVITPNCLGEDK
jgi:hypothetical protein